MLDDPEKSRQYAIAVRVVNGSQSPGIRTMPAAEDFRYITDAEVIGFVLEEGVCHDEIGHTALRCMYRNIDPNSPMAYRILETEYGRRLLVNDTTDLPAVMDSPEWMLLHRVTDREFLRKLAGSKEALGFFRWEACGMSGGHTFGEVNCACTVCGFENHSFGNPENAVICLKCGSKITHHVYGGGDLWSSYDCVTHPDGTTASLAFKEWQKYLSPQGS